jgi:hypothetical protein
LRHRNDHARAHAFHSFLLGWEGRALSTLPARVERGARCRQAIPLEEPFLFRTTRKARLCRRFTAGHLFPPFPSGVIFVSRPRCSTSAIGGVRRRAASFLVGRHLWGVVTHPHAGLPSVSSSRRARTHFLPPPWRPGRSRRRARRCSLARPRCQRHRRAPLWRPPCATRPGPYRAG